MFQWLTLLLILASASLPPIPSSDPITVISYAVKASSELQKLHTPPDVYYYSEKYCSNLSKPYVVNAWLQAEKTKSKAKELRLSASRVIVYLTAKVSVGYDFLIEDYYEAGEEYKKTISSAGAVLESFRKELSKEVFLLDLLGADINPSSRQVFEEGVKALKAFSKPTGSCDDSFSGKISCVLLKAKNQKYFQKISFYNSVVSPDNSSLLFYFYLFRKNVSKVENDLKEQYFGLVKEYSKKFADLKALVKRVKQDKLVRIIEEDSGDEVVASKPYSLQELFKEVSEQISSAEFEKKKAESFFTSHEDNFLYNAIIHYKKAVCHLDTVFSKINESYKRAELVLKSKKEKARSLLDSACSGSFYLKGKELFEKAAREQSFYQAFLDYLGSIRYLRLSCSGFEEKKQYALTLASQLNLLGVNVFNEQQGLNEVSPSKLSQIIYSLEMKAEPFLKKIEELKLFLLQNEELVDDEDAGFLRNTEVLPYVADEYFKAIALYEKVSTLLEKSKTKAAKNVRVFYSVHFGNVECNSIYHGVLSLFAYNQNQFNVSGFRFHAPEGLIIENTTGDFVKLSLLPFEEKTIKLKVVGVPLECSYSKDMIKVSSHYCFSQGVVPIRKPSNSSLLFLEEPFTVRKNTTHFLVEVPCLNFSLHYHFINSSTKTNNTFFVPIINHTPVFESYDQLKQDFEIKENNTPMYDSYDNVNESKVDLTSFTVLPPKKAYDRDLSGLLDRTFYHDINDSFFDYFDSRYEYYKSIIKEPDSSKEIIKAVNDLCETALEKLTSAAEHVKTQGISSEFLSKAQKAYDAGHCVLSIYYSNKVLVQKKENLFKYLVLLPLFTFLFISLRKPKQNNVRIAKRVRRFHFSK